MRLILTTPELESRHYLQAAHFLEEIGEGISSTDSKTLLGVVVEVGMEHGTDLVAAYTDHRARYYNSSGAGVVWERPTPMLDSAIDDMLCVGAFALKAIGPWKGERPAAPINGYVRINLLCEAGLHFGQGPFEALSKDPLGGPVFEAAFRLMQELIKVTQTPAG